MLPVSPHDPLFILVLSACVPILLYWVIRRAYPRPIPGIPYNIHALWQISGDLPELQARQKAGKSIRPWFLQQAGRHKSAIVQIFLGPFSKAAVLISDYREVSDILTHRDADFKRGTKTHVFAGILPHGHPAMETFDPGFKTSRDLIRDLMSPSFLNKVSMPQTYIVACDLLELWRLKARLSKGRPFDVVNDINEFTFDAILTAATGLEASGGGLKRQISYLSTREAQETVNSITPSKTVDEPVFFPAVPRSAKLQALGIDIESLWKGFYMPWPRLYHRVNKLRPSVRKAQRTIRGHIKSRIADAARRLGGGEDARSALDYVVGREIRASEKTGREPALDDPRIRDEIYGYLIAGHDTTTGSLIWLVRRLVASPEKQAMIRADLKETYSDAAAEGRLPTAAELTKQSPYLDAFIEEVLRFTCPVATIVVNTRRNTTILGYPVPEDTPVFLNLTGPSLNMPSIPVEEILRSKSSQARKHIRGDWDDCDPSTFLPERWLKEDQSGKVVFHAGSGPSLAFSAGTRGCWGKRLGYLELRIALTLLVWTFHFSEVPDELCSWDTYDSLVTAPRQCFVRLADPSSMLPSAFNTPFAL